MRLISVLPSLVLIAAPAAAHASPISSHLAQISWLNGTWKCTSNGIVGGKKQKAMVSTEVVKTSGNWITYYDAGKPNNAGEITYDPQKGKYVNLGRGDDGGYGVNYMTFNGKQLAIQYPSVVNNVPDDTGASSVFTTMGSNRLTFTNKGTSASGKVKGKTFTYTTVCTK